MLLVLDRQSFHKQSHQHWRTLTNSWEGGGSPQADPDRPEQCPTDVSRPKLPNAVCQHMRAVAVRPGEPPVQPDLLLPAAAAAAALASDGVGGWYAAPPACGACHALLRCHPYCCRET